MSNLTASRLKELLHYDQETGVFTWREPASGRKNPAAARGDKHGYRRIRIDGCLYYAHRLAWLYVYGEWPSTGLDHINGDPSDNRIVNLRQATQAQNARNVWRPSRSLPRGVYALGRRYEAKISAGGKRYYLGLFKTPQEASEAYTKAARELHGEFSKEYSMTAEVVNLAKVRWEKQMKRRVMAELLQPNETRLAGLYALGSNHGIVEALREPANNG